MRERHPCAKYDVYGRPAIYAGAVDLAWRDKYQCRWWAAWAFRTQTYECKDRGIDGNTYVPNGPHGLGRIIVSVKGGGDGASAMARELAGVVQRENAEMGVLVTLVDPDKASSAIVSAFASRGNP